MLFVMHQQPQPQPQLLHPMMDGPNQRQSTLMRTITRTFCYCRPRDHDRMLRTQNMNSPQLRRRRRGRIFLTSLYVTIVLLLVSVTWLFVWKTFQVPNDTVHSLSTGRKPSSLSSFNKKHLDNPPIPSSSQSQRHHHAIHIRNHTTLLTERPSNPIVIAYAISLIKVKEVCSGTTLSRGSSIEK
jgi:hypothetical protein